MAALPGRWLDEIQAFKPVGWGGESPKRTPSAADQPTHRLEGFFTSWAGPRHGGAAHRTFTAATHMRSCSESRPYIDKPGVSGGGGLTAPDETGMPLVNGAHQVRESTSLIRERRAENMPEFTGGLVL